MPENTPSHRVALETTLLVHGVPRESALPLADRLDQIIESQGATPQTVGVLAGKPIAGLSREQLQVLLDAESVTKANTSNLGVLMHRRLHAATTVSATMEIAASHGIRVFATGGIGGVHRGYGQHWDISSDLAAFTRFPVAVVASGVKNLLDVESTREALETLGVPVIGFGTDSFPAFYQRESVARVDARFDDPDELADFLSAELERTGRGVLVCSPIPLEDEIPGEAWAGWIRQAQESASDARGRAVTPAILSSLHRVSDGATLRANLALVEENCRVAALLASRM